MFRTLSSANLTTATKQANHLLKFLNDHKISTGDIAGSIVENVQDLFADLEHIASQIVIDPDAPDPAQFLLRGDTDHIKRKGKDILALDNSGTVNVSANAPLMLSGNWLYSRDVSSAELHRILDIYNVLRPLYGVNN